VPGMPALHQRLPPKGHTGIAIQGNRHVCWPVHTVERAGISANTH
jgi:hypothetical protein